MGNSQNSLAVFATHHVGAESTFYDLHYVIVYLEPDWLRWRELLYALADSHEEDDVVDRVIEVSHFFEEPLAHCEFVSVDLLRPLVFTHDFCRHLPAPQALKVAGKVKHRAFLADLPLQLRMVVVVGDIGGYSISRLQPKLLLR